MTKLSDGSCATEPPETLEEFQSDLATSESKVSNSQALSVHCETCPEDTTNALTVLAKHTIIPGKESEFEAWIKEMASLQQNVEGYLSSELIRPCAEIKNEYVSIFRYDSYEHLQSWMQSTERQQMIDKAKEFSLEPLTISYHSLEYLFVNDDPSSTNRKLPPPKWKMTVATFFVIWSQLQFVPNLVNFLPNAGFILRQAIGTAIICILTSYVMLPIVTRLLAFWLYPQEDYWENFRSLSRFCVKCGSEKLEQNADLKEKDIELGEP